MFNLNTIVNAQELSVVASTYAVQRFRDFQMRTLATMSNAAYRGMQSIRKRIDIPFGVCIYNNQLQNFITELTEQGYTVRQEYNKLYIKWGKDNQIDY